MRLLLPGLVVASFVSLVACTVQNSPGTGGASSSSSGAPSGSSSGGSSGTPSADGGGTNTSSSGGSSGSPSGTANGGKVDVDGTCSAFQACGGNPQGTYDYTGGCIEDVFAGARGACSELDTSKAEVTVKGTIEFAGNALKRNVTLAIGGHIVFPSTCTSGVPCSAIENELKNGFDSVTCVGTAECDCTISKTESDSDATTYTIQGSLVTTADGDQYSICEKGADLSYSGKSVDSEQGSFTLKKR